MKRSDPLLLALLLLFVLWRAGRNEDDDGAVLCRRPVIPHNMTHQGKSEPSQSSTVDCAGRGRDFQQISHSMTVPEEVERLLGDDDDWCIAQLTKPTESLLHLSQITDEGQTFL